MWKPEQSLRKRYDGKSPMLVPTRADNYMHQAFEKLCLPEVATLAHVLAIC
jgi:hypothetical protein